MKFIIATLVCMMVLNNGHAHNNSGITVGAEQTAVIVEAIANRSVGVVVNQTSRVGETHLLDTLMAMGIKPKAIFAPEHGFRGNADAGEYIKNGKDAKTGISIVSLYGKNKKPNAEQLKGIDVMIFDIQDAGARFYTYISTLMYVMQACAENGKELMVLDRPNPCDYIDGPILDMGYKSFVGMMPIPLLHGCTMGELAQMINGEGWLGKNMKCRLSIVKVEGWQHGEPYSLPVKPSPNLPNDKAIALYPSLCLFEATSVSVGRGTYYPFQVIGSPILPKDKFGFSFTPKSLPGFAKNPLHMNRLCNGLDLRTVDTEKGFSLKYFIMMRDEYKKAGKLDEFITRPQWLDLLIGTNQFRLDIAKGKTEEEIAGSWEADLTEYRKMRRKYLLYEE